MLDALARQPRGGDALHDDRQLARLRLGRARGRPVRPEGALDARPAWSLPRAPTRRSCSRSTSIPARRPTSRRSTATAGRSSIAARRWRRTPDAYRELHRRLAGRARHREERLRALALRMVQRSQRLLPGLGPAGDRAGHRLQPLPPDRRGPAVLRDRGRRARRGRGDRARLRAPRRAPRASSPRSSSTPTRCSRAARAAGAPRERAPTAASCADALERALGGARGCAVAVTALERRPCEYRTSFALEELDVTLEDGTALRLMFKDLSPRLPRRGRAARRSPPSCTTRGARSRPTATCSTAPRSAPPPTTAPRSTRRATATGCSSRTSPGPCCGRSASSRCGRRRRAGSRGCTPRCAAAAAGAAGTLLRYDPTSTAVDRARARVRRAPGNAVARRDARAWCVDLSERYEPVVERLAALPRHLHPRRVLRLQRAGPGRRAARSAIARSTGRSRRSAPA